MQIRRGPAAVTRDESRMLPLSVNGWEGAAGRMIGEPEDLPEVPSHVSTPWIRVGQWATEDEYGSPDR